MRTEYWYEARKSMRKLGFSKLKSKSIAWKLHRLSKDMVGYRDLGDATELLRNAFEQEAKIEK